MKKQGVVFMPSIDFDDKPPAATGTTAEAVREGIAKAEKQFFGAVSKPVPDTVQAGDISKFVDRYTKAYYKTDDKKNRR